MELNAKEVLNKKIPGLYVAGKTAKEAMSPPLPVAIPLRRHLQYNLLSADCQTEKTM